MFLLCWKRSKVGYFFNVSSRQKAAFVSPLVSWLLTLQRQRTPIDHWRESCTTRLVIHYYPIVIIERRIIWLINLRGWKDELLSSSNMSLNKKSEHFNYHFRATFKKVVVFMSAKVIVCDTDDKHQWVINFLYRVQWGSAKAEIYNHPISNEFIQPSLCYVSSGPVTLEKDLM